jgi:hypothetical protein
MIRASAIGHRRINARRLATHFVYGCVQRGNAARIAARKLVMPIGRYAGLRMLGGTQFVLPAPDQIGSVRAVHIISAI